jgi:dTDP-4-amino-4,6-dideoxygalactose transaminase
MTAGEGGAITTNQRPFICKKFGASSTADARNGDTTATKETSSEYNYRMTEFQAGVLIGQMKRLTNSPSCAPKTRII